MPNTTLPTNLSSGSTGHIGHSNIVNDELNRLSRDTGLRDLTGLLSNGWTVRSGGYVYIRRANDLVSVIISGLDGDAATSNVFLDFSGGTLDTNYGPLVTGMSPAAQVKSPLFQVSGVNTATWYAFFTANSFRLSEQMYTGSFPCEWNFTSLRNWPSSHPPEV